MEILQFKEIYNGKGDPLTHVKKFQTLCSDISHDQILLAKLFTRTIRDKYLQWYCYLPPYSITSFQQLVNSFIQQFHNNITLTDLIHCKQGVKEKVIDFIGRYKHLYSEISFLAFNQDIQRIFISNFQKEIRDKLLIFEFTFFLQLCIVLHNYQLTMSQLEQSPSMDPSDKGDSAQQLFAKFKPNKGFIKFNDNNNKMQVVATTRAPPLSKYFKREKQFTPLKEYLHRIMSHLLQRDVLKLPPIKPIDPSKINSP